LHPFSFFKYIYKHLKKNSNKDKIYFYLLEKEKESGENKFNKQVQYRFDKHPLKTNKFKMSSSKDDGMSSYIKSKLLGAYKSTKESPYVKSLYNETAAAFSSGNSYIERGFNAGDSKQFPDQLDKLPSNTQIIMYPAYAKFENGYYITRIKGTVIATGIMNRTNRFLLNMARRISKSSDAEIGYSGSLGSQFEKEIKDAITYQENYRRNDEETSQYSNSITADDTLKSRMQGILAKTIPNVTLDVTIGTAVAGVELVKSEVRTDNLYHHL